MSPEEKIEAAIANLHERRREILILPEIEYRLAMFSEVDESDRIMAQKIAGQCNDHFDAVLLAVRSSQVAMQRSQVSQINAIQEMRVITDANLTAIRELTEEFRAHKASLQVMAGVEGVGKTGVGIIKAVGTWLGDVGAFCKRSLPGIAVIAFIVAMFFGRISITEIWKNLSKALGAE